MRSSHCSALVAALLLLSPFASAALAAKDSKVTVKLVDLIHKASVPGTVLGAAEASTAISWQEMAMLLGSRHDSRDLGCCAHVACRSNLKP